MDIGKRFDQVASKYDTPDKYERSQIFVNKILQFVPADKNFRVLDVGAGTGTVDLILSPYVKEIVATDLSEGMLEVFREKIRQMKIKNIKIYKKDLFSDEFPEKDFDLIITSMTFHHLKDPVSALKKLKDFLKDKGYIAVIDLYKEDGSFHSDNADVEHFGFDEKDVEKWIKEADLKKVYYGIIHNIEKNNKEYPVFLIIITKN